VHVQELPAQIEDDEGEQEVRDREADEGEDVVADRVLADRGVDADRQRDPPGDDDGGDGDDDREPEPVADDLLDRPAVLEGEAELAARNCSPCLAG